MSFRDIDTTDLDKNLETLFNPKMELQAYKNGKWKRIRKNNVCDMAMIIQLMIDKKTHNFRLHILTDETFPAINLRISGGGV